MAEFVPVPTDPGPPRRSPHATRQAWVERLDRFARSGLRPAPFCAQEGVSLPAFYSWKRRLAAPALDAPTRDARPDPGRRLLPVRLPSPVSATVELLLPTGALLRLFPGCDLAFVRSLLAALGDPPC